MNGIFTKLCAPDHTAEILPISEGLHVFTDGSYEPTSAKGGWAFVVYRNGAEIASEFGGARPSADNTMELTALFKAALWVNGNASGERAIVWSDSVYAVNGCNSWRQIWKNNGWKKIVPNAKARSRTIANAELWMAIDLQLSRNPQLAVAWCKGHSGLVGNERADTLAGLARQSARCSDR
ncbi:ribonuclease HI [Ensifer sp. T173]|uniref:ribonuclease H n=1 Tax=Ensifer canadensis TaxID=555315 RepID=A0AAW4FVX9_9HYPH|nr:ribonuclease H [Ensifer canadensis]MBM3095429.1 ribonuclease HI [Ensifer canadensis]UBI78518.1 ribonuclease HI [Ensifer canadensis]